MGASENVLAAARESFGARVVWPFSVRLAALATPLPLGERRSRNFPGALGRPPGPLRPSRPWETCQIAGSALNSVLPNLVVGQQSNRGLKRAFVPLRQRCTTPCGTQELRGVEGDD